MKKQSSLSLLLLVAFFTTSCSRPESDTKSEQSLVVTVTGRVKNDDKNIWETADAIGIYMLNGKICEATNKKYTALSGGTKSVFTPVAIDQAISLPEDESKRDFVAYYPYAAIENDNIYAVNITNQTSQKAINLMAAKKVEKTTITNPDVSFVFTGKLAKIKITLNGDGKSITDEQLMGTVVKIANQQTKGTYNVVEGGDITPDNDTPVEITLLSSDNGLKAEGLVLPNDNTNGMTLTFTTPGTGKKQINWHIQNDLPLKFEAGKTYEYKVVASEGVVKPKNIENVTIGDFYLSDGTLLDKNAMLTDDQKRKCIGIVFWTGNIKGDNYGLLDSKFPNGTHGLVASLHVLSDSDDPSKQEMFWTYGEYEYVNDWLKTSVWAGDISRPNEFTSIQQEDKLQGYANTIALQEYNKTKEENDKKRIKPIYALAKFTEIHTTPANSSGWYWPSITELKQMCWGEADIQSADNKDMLNAQFAKVNGKEFEDSYKYYWSSTEGFYLPQSAWYVSFDNGYNHYVAKTVNDFSVRPILAF